MIIATTERINDTTLTEIRNLTVSTALSVISLMLLTTDCGFLFIQNTLEVQIIALNTTASQLNVICHIKIESVISCHTPTQQNVADVIDAADRATAQLLGENGTEIVLNVNYKHHCSYWHNTYLYQSANQSSSRPCHSLC